MTPFVWFPAKSPASAPGLALGRDVQSVWINEDEEIPLAQPGEDRGRARAWLPQEEELKAWILDLWLRYFSHEKRGGVGFHLGPPAHRFRLPARRVLLRAAV